MATDNNELQVHQATYHKVINVLKYGGLAVLVIALAVIWLISGK